MDYNHKSSGVAKGGLTTGIIGTSLGALALLGGGASALTGGLGGSRNTGLAQAYMDGIMMNALAGGTAATRGSCESDHLVTRYDADKDARIAELETQVALRDSNTYTDKKMLELYQYVDGRLRGIEGQICQQAVTNQHTMDQFQLVRQEQECCCTRMQEALAAEKAARCCGDSAIVNYANATFYPQLIADLTPASTAKPQATWNPVTNCGCTCNG